MDCVCSQLSPQEFDIAVSTDKLLVVACESVQQILSVDVAAYPHCSNGDRQVLVSLLRLTYVPSMCCLNMGIFRPRVSTT